MTKFIGKQYNLIGENNFIPSTEWLACTTKYTPVLVFEKEALKKYLQEQHDFYHNDGEMEASIAILYVIDSLLPEESNQ